MSGDSFTLKDLKASAWEEHPLADIAFGMKKSGFHRWGFVIYQTTYDDDAAWERYLEVLKLTARDCLADLGGDVLLEQYMDWPVISDPVELNGASKAQVRHRFKDWCAGRSEERDGPGATKNRAKRLPRFKHCLYVDRKSLDSLTKMPANYLETHGKDHESNVVVVVVDGSFDESTRHSDQGLHPDVDGCTEWYVGWRYEEVEQVVETYHEAHQYPLSDFDYKRPPLISPRGLDSMPT